MLNIIKFLLFLAFGLAGLVACSPFPDSINIGNDSSVIEACELLRSDSMATELTTAGEYWNDAVWEYHGRALVETWVGRKAVNVGDVTGEGLYETVKDYIEQTCKSNKDNQYIPPDPQAFDTHEIVKGKFPDIRSGEFRGCRQVLIDWRLIRTIAKFSM